MIRIVAVGKISQHLKETQEHYLKRISRFTKVEVIEIKKRKSREEEGKLLTSKMKNFTIALDERGETVTSKEFAALLQNHRNISFLIGGADGLSEEVKKRAHRLLSLSRLTLQHDIARIVLLEQIYRGFHIIKGTPYHRE
ncbi:23S rRNA (pseudouridine(1915)-N(3))-methyltransferase RlmH [Desulfurobacterium sp.]